MDLPNTRLWRDDSRPMASSPRTVSLSRFRSLASRRRRSAPAFGRAPITGAQNRKSALTENAPYKACSGFTRVTARPLVSYQINRQLSGWNLPPLVMRAFGAHSQKRTRAPQQSAPLFDHLIGYRQ